MITTESLFHIFMPAALGTGPRDNIAFDLLVGPISLLLNYAITLISRFYMRNYRSMDKVNK
jgi:hypothetical protein